MLLLPLAALGQRAMRQGAAARLLFLCLFLTLALPDAYMRVWLPATQDYLPARVRTALLLLPCLALVGTMIWSAALCGPRAVGRTLRPKAI